MWTKEQAWEWYNNRPLIRGYNGYPSNCVNRIAMWQKYKHDEVAKQLEYEFNLAKETGFNAVRTLIQFEVWLYEHDSFMANLEEYFTLASKYGISVMLTIGNDCCVPKEFYVFDKDHFGEQRVDWGYHSGIKRGQHSATHGSNVGYLLADDDEYRGKFIEMVDELAREYAKDERLLIWNVWNEIGANNRGTLSVPLMEKCCEIIRSYSPIQPLTIECWRCEKGIKNIREAEIRGLELSDIVSFHHYGSYADMVCVIEELKEKYGRPMLNSEWLNRIQHNNVEELFPLFYIEKIGSFLWGLIQGYSQTYEPWGAMYDQLDNPNLDTTKWMHDLYRFNGYPYIPKEIELIKRFSKLADERFEREKNNKK